MKRNNSSRRSSRNGQRYALTLIELVVVLTAGALLLGLAVPVLHAARAASKSEICLGNLREMMALTHEYTLSAGGRLPGPVIPSIPHDQLPLPTGGGASVTIMPTFLSVLGPVVGPRSNARLVTCPTMAEIVPDEYFAEFRANTGRVVFPFHYTLNNWGNAQPTSPPAPRGTHPAWYFGVRTSSEVQPPVHLGEIANPGREWGMADAWFRSRTIPYSWFQQEGTYQSAWSGEALPCFPPHLEFRRPPIGTQRGFNPTTVAAANADGLTNTAYFDGHAAAVPSRSCYIGPSQLFYGFRGTVNCDPIPQHFLDIMRWE
jgi:prepilin-type processing-associated H-X9-DG protein